MIRNVKQAHRVSERTTLWIEGASLGERNGSGKEVRADESSCFLRATRRKG